MPSHGPRPLVVNIHVCCYLDRNLRSLQAPQARCSPSPVTRVFDSSGDQVHGESPRLQPQPQQILVLSRLAQHSMALQPPDSSVFTCGAAVEADVKASQSERAARCKLGLGVVVQLSLSSSIHGNSQEFDRAFLTRTRQRSVLQAWNDT